MRKKTFKLSIVTPFYNEAQDDMIDIYFKTLSVECEKHTKDWEIIAIDDGSIDETFKLLQAQHQQNNKIKVVKLSRNFGKEAALTAGLKYASGDVAIPMDADLQHPPALFTEMLAEWQTGYDVVIPIRSTRDDPVFKKITSNLFYTFIRIISDKRFIVKNASDFRLMDRKLVDAINNLPEYHRFMKGLLTWAGFRQKYIICDCPKRMAGQTKFNYRRLLALAFDAIFAFSTAPIRLIILAGFGLAFVSFAYGAWLIFQKLHFGSASPGYPSLMVTILFLGGMQMVAIGIIGEYVGRIYGEVKKRPIYVVDEYLS